MENKPVSRIRRISYWLLLSAYSGWILLYLSLGRMTMASPSVVKDRDALVVDLYMTIVVSLSLLLMTSGWWRLVSLPVLVIGMLGNAAGWDTESARYHDQGLQRLVPNDLSLLVLPISVVFAVSLTLFALNPKRRQPSA